MAQSAALLASKLSLNG